MNHMKSVCLSKFLIIFVLYLFPYYSSSQQIDSIRPKVGLVLSGGGAKGLAHIGVLKVIEKHDIPIDYITGTSMGSIIGALYSIGYSAAEIEEIALSMNWDEIFNGSTPRRLIAIEEKDLEGKFLLEIPVEKGKSVIPTGLISAQKLEMELSKVTWSVHGLRDFSKFQIPFACIATDIERGEAIVLKSGFLPDALRASMAIPSVFTAVEIDGKLLVDGGLIRNFPVSDVKNMGAQFVIGIDVAAPLYKKDELNSMLKIMEQAASFSNEKTNEKETQLVDLLIKPDITGYDASSFSAAEILIKNGENAALAIEDKLIELKKKLNSITDTAKTSKIPPALHSIFIHSIQFEGLNKVSRNLVKSKLSIKESSWISLKDIEKAVAILYGSRYFEKVNYRLEVKDTKTNLIIRFSEQPFSIYKVGLNYNNIFNASVLLNATYRNILGEGSRLILSSKLGFMPEFNVDYTIFTKLKPSIGFRAHANYYYLKESIYGYNDSLNLEMGNNAFAMRLGAASSLSNSTIVSIGAEFSYHYFVPKSLNFSGTIPERSGIKLFGELKFDKIDRNVYPSSGANFELDVSYMLDELIPTDITFDKKFWKIRLDYEHYIPLFSKLNFRQFIRAGLSFSDSLFCNDQYFLGGEINFQDYIFPFAGYQFMQLKENQVLAAGIGIRYEPWPGKFFLVDFNAGLAEHKLQNIFEPGKVYTGGTIGIGIKTFIGPIEYRIGTNNFDYKVNHWIQIGYFF